ncbi:MAG: hypothetical protein QM779_13930 [Propionicimonas sp.]|uniref:hypothetical protein n=1 Tax=Propionicimonas sp. TaxID=1955623 RepID=UPI003D0BC59A
MKNPEMEAVLRQLEEQARQLRSQAQQLQAQLAVIREKLEPISQAMEGLKKVLAQSETTPVPQPQPDAESNPKPVAADLDQPTPRDEDGPDAQPYAESLPSKQPWIDLAFTEVPIETTFPNRKRFRSTKFVTDLLTEDPRVWGFEEILRAFERAGATSSMQNPEGAVRTAIGRAINKGEVVQVDDDHYRAIRDSDLLGDT